MQKIIMEGKARINVFIDKTVSKKLPVFYNPVMKLNRDVSVLLLNSIGKKNMQIALPLAGSGVRGIRFLLELDKGIIKNINFNDNNKQAINLIMDNINLNKIKKHVNLYNKDANRFLLESTGFDYIDVDPFGTPTPFLDAAVKRISRDGILAVTATDTSALSGSSSKACLRKYWAKPLKNEFMHETGIRILIRKVQLIGAENSKALIPIFSYAHKHYYRVFFRCEKGKQKVDKILNQHKFLLYNKKTLETKVSESNNEKGFEYAGPLWTGRLWDSKLVNKMFKVCKDNKELYNLMKLISEECEINVVGFYDLHKIAKIRKTPIPRIENVLKKGKVVRTHFLGWGVRIRNMPI